MQPVTAGGSAVRLAIDGTNLRTGGGVTHLLELLRHADPARDGFDAILLWAPRATLARIPDRPWLHKRWEPVFEAGYLRRALWQRFALARRVRAEGCTLLLAPGGSFATSFRPVVTMSRNMLPFDRRELRRYGWSAYRLKLELLRRVQAASLRRADGRIFLTRHAQDVIGTTAGPMAGPTAIVPHGVDVRFALAPRPARPLAACSAAAPLRLLYVSTVDLYKHQGAVAQAVASLRAQGLPLVLDLVGGAYPPALPPLQARLRALDPEGRFLRYHGAVPYEQLDAHYRDADVAVFASSCENMPNTLLEMMAASLPIACSARPPMPEVLGEAGLYFDPEDPADIATVLRRLVVDEGLRAALARAAGVRARDYRWADCAERTFALLREVAAGRPALHGAAAA